MRNESSEKCSAKGKTGERYSRPSGDTIPMRRIIILLTVLISVAILGVEFLLFGNVADNLVLENYNPSGTTRVTAPIDSATTISGTVDSSDETTTDTTPPESTAAETTADTTPPESTATEMTEETVAPEKPAEIQIDADMLKSIVYGETTVNLLYQHGLELTVEEQLKIAKIYRIKDTEILVAFGRHAESPIDETVVVAISAPAHLVIPDKIGAANDAFIENRIIYVPDGKICGDVGTGLFFGWPEEIPNKIITEDTIVCFTGTNPPASSYEVLCYFYGEYGFCKQCGVAMSEDTVAFEGFGVCIDCYYENLDPEDICDNCGADCSFMGKIEGLCMICYNAKYPDGGGSCVNCGTSVDQLDENGLCEDCVCTLCGGPLTEEHDCNNYPNIVCANCRWEGFVANADVDGVTCPICRTRIMEPSDEKPEDSAAPDKPAEIQIDADMLKSIVYGESTINLLRQYGLELTFEDRLKIAEIYRIKDTEILVALGRAAESPIDESVVVAISAPAHVVIPDKIGSPNDAFIENSIIFVPDGKISGDVGTGLFFGWPEGIPSKIIAKDTIVCFTGTNPPASSYEGLCYFYIKDGFCKQCGVALSEDTTAFEGFGICIDCYYENLGPEDICDNCGADCSFMGKIEGLCMICYDAKYPSSGGSCVNCGASELLLDENGLCEDCVCPLCGGPLTEDHDCNNYPNIVCTNCDWEGFVAGAGADGVTCPICRTQVIEPSDDEPEDSAE